MHRSIAIIIVLAVTGALLGAFAVRPSASGPTFVSGAIGTDTTWALSDSPFIVTGDVGIAPGVTLTIEPGVEVRFDGFYKILDRGTLKALGTSAQPIVFTRNGAAS